MHPKGGTLCVFAPFLISFSLCQNCFYTKQLIYFTLRNFSKSCVFNLLFFSFYFSPVPSEHDVMSALNPSAPLWIHCSQAIGLSWSQFSGFTTTILSRSLPPVKLWQGHSFACHSVRNFTGICFRASIWLGDAPVSVAVQESTEIFTLIPEVFQSRTLRPVVSQSPIASHA